MSKQFSPSRLLIKAMEIYLKDENITIEQMLEDKKGSDLRLHTISFALKNLLSHYGYEIDTVIADDKIMVKSNGIGCYLVEDNFNYIKTVQTLCFKLILIWGHITDNLDKIGYTHKDIDKTTQISLAI